MRTTPADPAFDIIRALPFVSDLRVADGGADRIAKIKSAAGTVPFTVEVKRSYLDRSSVSTMIALAHRLEKDGRPPLLLLARYIPRSAGEALVSAGICFADDSGNVNLRLGDRFHALVLGNRDQGRPERGRRLSPGTVQMLFVALAEPNHLSEPVRRLAAVAGVGKSTAAEVRQQLSQERLIAEGSSGEYRVTDEKVIRERFLLGYSQVLRPDLHIGTFRGPYKGGDAFVDALAKASAQRGATWSLTGGAGAFAIDHFYRGDSTVAFVGGWGAEFARDLRLLPDPAGPITLLRPFSDAVKWEGQADRPVAHPWLIYAELLHNGEPRAIEAAEELRRNHLE